MNLSLSMHFPARVCMHRVIWILWNKAKLTSAIRKLYTSTNGSRAPVWVCACERCLYIGKRTSNPSSLCSMGMHASTVCVWMYECVRVWYTHYVRYVCTYTTYMNTNCELHTINAHVSFCKMQMAPVVIVRTQWNNFVEIFVFCVAISKLKL